MAALLLRLALAVLTEGYPYDMSCFVAWGDKLAAQGPAAFYTEGYFADYPPGYLLVLGLVGVVRRALAIPYEAPLTYLLLALVPALCDCAAVVLVWRTAAPLGARPQRWLALFTAFCPLTLFDTGVWKQIDSAFALPLLLCFLLLEQNRWLPAALAYGVALAIKPQALLAGPVLAACFLAGVAQAAQSGRRGAVPRAVGRVFGGAALALLPPMAAGLPFYGLEVLRALPEKYLDTASGYPYATINAFNWFAALGGNWRALDDRLLGVVPWGLLGTLHILLVTAALVALAVAGWRRGRFSPLLLAAGYLVGIFTFAHCMHERYLVVGALLVLLAAARWGDVRLYGAGVGLALTGFLNIAAVYSLVGSDDEWLTSATSQLFAGVTGLAETACCLLLFFAICRITLAGQVVAFDRTACRAGALPRLGRQAEPAPPAAQPAWAWRERLALLALTAATAALSFGYLGDTTAPQSCLDANGSAASVTVQPQGEAAALWVYPGISASGNGRLTVTDANGTVQLDLALGYGNPFTWSAQAVAGPGPYTVTVTDGQVFELAFRDSAGALLPVDAAAAQSPLFDEQAAVPQAISQLNSFYFDEIYHARTAYEQLHGMQVYETTHPPLGKDLIMLGIALFGMTGFGWRFSGALFGVLLVPLAWCFARRLTRKPWLGAMAGVLLALDFMRFSQSRIATIDVYATFFILLGAHCMLWYCQAVLEKGVQGALLPMALGGVAFGLGCAAKWTGIYAGMGLAVLYLGVLYARWQQRPKAFWAEFRLAAAGGVVFYIAVPLAIYLAAYLPYLWHDPGFSLADWWDCQRYMYWYHSSLEASHPFESRWYTWLLGLRPVWYYMNGSPPAGTQASIAGLGGPVIWLAGLGCMLALLWRQVSGRGSRRGAGVLVLYAAQLVPWMMVTRCTFLYHYFPSSMFCLAAIALVLAQWKEERRARQVAAALCGAALVLFVWYYPVLSGLPVPAAWAQSLKVLPSFGFY